MPYLNLSGKWRKFYNLANDTILDRERQIGSLPLQSPGWINY